MNHGAACECYPCWSERQVSWRDKPSTTHGNLTPRQVEEHACPRCGAGSGQPCRTPTGYGARTHHPRIVAALLARGLDRRLASFRFALQAALDEI